MVSFFAKFMVEDDTLAVFFGWVTGFFLSKDFTVLEKLFSLFSLLSLLYFTYLPYFGGLRVFTEDYFSLLELSFTFRAFS